MFQLIWPSSFRGGDLKKLPNQKQELPESSLKLPSQMNRNLVGSIYMYGRLCIKFPQSRMKGEPPTEPLVNFNFTFAL
jgi:hypothetical protein